MKLYAIYRITLLPVILNDNQGHSGTGNLSKCNTGISYKGAHIS